MKISGYLAALAATVVWAGNFVAARALAEQIPPVQFNFWRWVIAFIAILPFGVFHIRNDLQVLRENIRYLSLIAIIGITLMNAFIYKAGQTTESLNMALIMPATPAVVILAGHFVYGDALGSRRILGMITATLGIIVLISRGSLQRVLQMEFMPGDLWTLAGMASFAIYSLLIRQRPQNISAIGFNLIVFALGILFSLPLLAFEIYHTHLPQLSWPVILGIAYSGVGCSAVAFWLWTIAIDRIGADRSSLVYYSLPLFAAIMAWLILGEKIAPVQIGGGALIIMGIILATLQREKSG